MTEEEKVSAENLPISADGLAVCAERAETPAFDIQTVEKAISGDDEAFALLFRKTYRRMYFVARGILQNDEDIYDALQIGYAKAYRFIHRLAVPEAFYAWLARVIENAAKDVWRDMHAYEDAGWMAEETLFSEDTAKDSDRRTDVDRALEQLEPALCEVLTLYYYDGLKLKDIAALLGETVSTVHRRLQKAKSKLKEILRQQGIDDAIYSGGVGTMIAVSLRSLIGTDILSAAVAQKMLDEILAGKSGKLEQAAYVLIKQQRNRAVLRAVSLLMALCVGASLLAVALTHGFPRLPAASAGGVGVTAVSTTTGFGSFTQNGGASSQMTTASFTTVVTQTTGGTTLTGVTTQAGNTGTTAGTQQTTARGSASTQVQPTGTTAATDTFVPDYRAGYANALGKSANAVLGNSNRIAEQDGWIYFLHNGTSLQKCRNDGTKQQHLLSMDTSVSCLNAVGDWLYYTDDNAVWRVRTDGSKQELFAETGEVTHMQVVGNAVYYAKYVSGKAAAEIWRLDCTTRKAAKVTEAISDFLYMAVSGERLFYGTSASGVWTQSLDGGEKRCVFAAAQGTSLMLDEENTTAYICYTQSGDQKMYAVNYADAGATAKPCTTLQINSGYRDLGDEVFTQNICFFSTYEGGTLGYWSYGPSCIGNRPSSWNTQDGHTAWDFELTVSTEAFCALDDGYVYFWDVGCTLYRALPDGSEMVAIM